MVVIGIVLYNSSADLPACWASLTAQTYPHLQIIFLDNYSSDASVEWVQKHAPQSTLICSDVNQGFGPAHNAIMQSYAFQPTDYYLPLNPDVSLSATYIEQLVSGCERHQAGWVSGKLLEKDEHDQPSGYFYSAGQGIRRDGYVVNRGEGVRDHGQYDADAEVFFVSGAAPLIAARMIQAVSVEGALFDPQMFMYGEDADLGWRAKLQGWSCWYIPSAVALHRGGNPNVSLRAQALINTFLSTVKNAFLLDLIFYNFPLIFLSLGVRMLLRPQQTWPAVHQFFSRLMPTLKRRTQPTLSRSEMVHWFRWSEQQTSHQATGLVQRVRTYLSRKT